MIAQLSKGCCALTSIVFLIFIGQTDHRDVRHVVVRVYTIRMNIGDVPERQAALTCVHIVCIVTLFVAFHLRIVASV